MCNCSVNYISCLPECVTNANMFVTLVHFTLFFQTEEERNISQLFSLIHHLGPSLSNSQTGANQVSPPPNRTTMQDSHLEKAWTANWETVTTTTLKQTLRQQRISRKRRHSKSISGIVRLAMLTASTWNYYCACFATEDKEIQNQWE